MFVLRRKDRTRSVYAAWTEPQFLTQEELPAGNADLMRYLNRSPVSQVLVASLGLSTDDIGQLATRAGVYVDWSPDGDVIATWPTPQRDGQTLLPHDSPALQAFLENPNQGLTDDTYEIKWGGALAKFRIIRKSDQMTMVEGLATKEEAEARREGMHR